ncbi:MAG: PilZ domain-containing protein [Chthonomonas sp.]|nr:PilZ domain-containing protein [Chthonomonas sp.]
MSEGNGNDGRRFKRWDVFEYALITPEGENSPEPAVIVDLSLGGVQVRGRKQYPAGHTVVITIAQDGEKRITTNAEVRYSHTIDDSDLFSTGFKFVPANMDQRVELVNFIHHRFQEGLQQQSA